MQLWFESVWRSCKQNIAQKTVPIVYDADTKLCLLIKVWTSGL